MTEEHFAEIVPDALDGQRIDRVVAIIAEASRRQAGELVTAGGVRVDGAVVDKASIKVVAGQSVVFGLAREIHTVDADPAIEIPVVFSDDQVIVVDKPPGLVVHPGSGVRGSTMVNGLLARFPELADVGEVDRPGIVHRLDRGTSGLLVVARTAFAYHNLVGQLADRTVERQYRTVADGHVESDAGLIDAPLGRSPRQATIRAVVADGRPARTRYEVRDRLRGLSSGESRPVTHLTCRLETGRTHQIRAHLTAIGHPVVGDVDYGGPVLDGPAGAAPPVPTATAGGEGQAGESLGSDGEPTAGRLRRPFLHAEELGFTHPSTGEAVRFSAPLPADLQQLLDTLTPAD